MVKKPDSNKSRAKRHSRVRGKISGTPECPRLNVFRSAKHIYAQVIDDVNGVTLASASGVPDLVHSVALAAEPPSLDFAPILVVQLQPSTG